MSSPISRRLAAAVALALLPAPALAQQSGSNVAPGVNPKDNITKTDVIINHANLEGGASVSTLAFKFDYALDRKWGGNIEVPISHFSAPGIGETGLGDIAVRARYVDTFGRVSVIGAVEAVAPTATSGLLGTGRWQLNPVVGAVYAFNSFNFAFVGYKHYFSVAGDDARPDIDRSEVRGLLARLTPKGRWMLADVKYARAHVDQREETLDLEFEYGAMIAKSLALSGRIGTSFLDSTRDFGMGVNLRKIW